MVKLQPQTEQMLFDPEIHLQEQLVLHSHLCLFVPGYVTSNVVSKIRLLRLFFFFRKTNLNTIQDSYKPHSPETS